jgi:hypothetical protein
LSLDWPLLPAARLLGAVLLCLLLLSPATARTTGGAPVVPDSPGSTAAQDSSRVALALFLSYEGQVHPPFDAAALHRGAWSALAAALEARGLQLVQRPEVEPVLREKRVRTGLRLNAGLLNAADSLWHAGRLLVCDLSLGPDRLLLTGRAMSVPTGELIWAGLAESGISSDLGTSADSAAWLSSIEPVCRHLAARWEAAPRDVSGPLTYLLPVRRSGVDPSAAGLVTHCLLLSLLRTTRRVQDPGVTAGRLAGAGIDPEHYDRRARFLLAQACGPGELMVGEISAYEAPPPPAARLGDDDLPDLPPIQLPAASLSLRLVDAASGEVRYAVCEYVGTPELRGIFGWMKRPTLERRFQPLTDRLVRAAGEKG